MLTIKIFKVKLNYIYQDLLNGLKNKRGYTVLLLNMFKEILICLMKFLCQIF